MAAAGGTSDISGASGLAIKTSDIAEEGRRAVRETEEAATTLEAVTLVLTLPDGAAGEMSVPGGHEVGRVKLELAEKFDLSASDIVSNQNFNQSRVGPSPDRAFACLCVLPKLNYSD